MLSCRHGFQAYFISYGKDLSNSKKQEETQVLNSGY